VHAVNGERAVAAYAAEPFEMVLMDCEMPVMDGFAATRELRSLERQQRRARVPIIALTAHALAEHRDACIAAGMDDYLSKPLDYQRLRACVLKWLALGDSPSRAGLEDTAGPVRSNPQGAGSVIPLRRTVPYH
jgi:CheY-like chemotaxis protein